ncbi:hypothetical protein ES705_05938 [subsurface metagenome]
MKRKVVSILIAVMLLCSFMAIPVQAADPDDIEASIVKGLEWLAAQQQPDGSWSPGYEPVALTGFALVKLCDRAYETGYSPFDPNYMYSEEVEKGLEYLFGDASAAGVGICFAAGGYETYSTGIAMMAIAATRAPDTIVPSGFYAGQTFKQVLQGNVDYLAWGQCDAPAAPRGGWNYAPNQGWADQSNTGYAVLGLRYAEADIYGFKCNISPWVKPELDFWINYVQNPDGGSDYDGTWDQSNLLRTGNLLFEQSFVSIPEADSRVQGAISFIQNNWVGGTDSQAMYCLMKGLQSYDIDTITVGGNPVDWYDVLADYIIAQQHPDGYWDGLGWNQMLDTVFALLTLEKVSPPPPVDVEFDMPACACDVDGYDVEVTYTVERIPSTGTVEVYKDSVLYDTITLTDFSGTESKLYTIVSDTPGMHTWKAVIDVTTGAGAQAHAEDDDVINVCETPDVLDIPDQTAPFETFDLDDYIVYGGAGSISWINSTPPLGWTVAIDGENVVTVTAPEGAGDPVIITFTASTEYCQALALVCSDSDDATFIPNLPPDCSEAYADPGCLWSPNHKFVDIVIMGVTDPDGDPITINIDAITSDEPTASDKGSGGEKHAPDASGIGTDTAAVRAERSGTSDGRVYMIWFTASDGRGGECEGSVMVKVPHDQSSEDCTAIDSGQDYDATQMN